MHGDEQHWRGLVVEDRVLVEGPLSRNEEQDSEMHAPESMEKCGLWRRGHFLFFKATDVEKSSSTLIAFKIGMEFLTSGGELASFL